MQTREQMLHPGEILAQQRFNQTTVWTEARLARMFRQSIDDETALWLEGLPFFFIATASAEGQCDCSFRGREAGPLLKVIAPRRLVFPDFPGNRLFNSLGNLLVNPQLGMLFIDFAAQIRLRVNGKARVVENTAACRGLWPEAARLIEVETEQVFGNCSRRIPRMTIVAEPQEWQPQTTGGK